MIRTMRRCACGERWASWLCISGLLIFMSSLHCPTSVEWAFSQQLDQPRAVAEPARETEGEDEWPLHTAAVARLGTLRLRHNCPVHDVAFSPDGKSLASVGAGLALDDDSLRLWSVRSGGLLEVQTLQSVLCARTLPRSRSDLSFAPHGSAVALTYCDRVILWDLKDDGGVRWLGARDQEVNGVAFSPDGKSLAWGSVGPGAWDPRILVYDTATARQVQQFAVRSPVKSLCFSPTGKMIATTDRDGVVDLWDILGGSRRRSIVGRGIRDIGFSPDGSHLAGSGEKGPVCLWNATTGEETRTITIADGEVSDLAFAGSSKLVAALLVFGLDEGKPAPSVLVWDTTTGKLVTRQTVTHGDRRFAFSTDGKLLATAGGWGCITLRTFPGNRNVLDLPGHIYGVKQVEYLADGKSLVSCGWDGKVLLWEIARQRPIWQVCRPGYSVTMAVSPKNNALAIGSRDRGVQIWNVARRQREKTYKVGKGDSPSALQFSSDGSYLACGDSGGAVLIWDTRTDRIIRKWGAVSPDREEKAIQSLAWSPDRKTLVTADGYRVRWLNAETGAVVRISPESQDYDFRAVTFSPNGKVLAESNSSSFVLRRATDGRQMVRIDAKMPNALALSPDSMMLAVGGFDGAIRLIDVRTGKLCGLVQGHAGPVEGLAFSPGGQFLASGAGDTTILIWNVQRIVEQWSKNTETSDEVGH